MTDRKSALQSKIGELMGILETIRNHRIHSVVVHISPEEPRTYGVDGLRDALSSLAAEVNASSAATIEALEGKYEHDRSDVLRIVGRLAEIVASTSTGEDFGTVTKQLSTF